MRKTTSAPTCTPSLCRPSWASRRRTGRAAHGGPETGWRGALAGAYAAPAWRRKWGGGARPFRKQVIYQEELARARVPHPPGNGVPMCGPTIVKYGTEAQRERFLRPMLRADELWAQGFREPDAGSDLPSLRTTA